ncbi:hypothetical protein BOX15_Mlig023229g2 [Macrostomum lignano]|uniref:FZ domain-containing protein n=1 Tax=Macrostomum lignano TaxID=282301 RepID=A0A267E032_9PLAT|nr:hypothetical protein BOX15_Mlig023229g2 [Macrostomum lignano]
MPKAFLAFFLQVLLLLQAQAATTASSIEPNVPEYNRTCASVDNLRINKVCSGLPNETLRLFGEDFGVHYIRGKTKSRVFVGLIVSKCQPGEYCVHLAQAEPTELEDRLLLSWRDDRVRSNLCRLRPCLNRLSACPAAKLIDQDRQLTFNAVDLLCGLTELQQAGGGLDGGKNSVPYCLEGVLDLLQYAYADVAREAGNASAQRVCDCVGRPGIPCPVQCRQIIYKLNCLYSQCRQHEQIHIARFPAWNWYFSKADALKSKYNVTFCERPIETAAAAEGKQGPVILAFFPNMSNVVMAVVLIVVVAALLMVGVTCLCWQRIFLNRYSRDRVGYTEVKGTL